MEYYFVGDEQIYPWIKHSTSVQKVLDSARRDIRNGRLKDVYLKLAPLTARGNPEALFLASMVRKPRESAAQYQRRHIEHLKASADQEYPQALYALGRYYDIGEMVNLDKTKAGQLFKRAAELKHAQSQCIYGQYLLYGLHGFEKDESTGIAYVIESAKFKFQGALELLAIFYEKGEFGFPVDPQRASSLRDEAKGDDVISY